MYDRNSSSILQCCRVPSASSDRLPVFEEEKRNRYQSHAEETKDAGSPVNADIVVHGRNEQRKRGSKSAAQKDAGSYCARGVLVEGVDEIISSTGQRISRHTTIAPLRTARYAHLWKMVKKPTPIIPAPKHGATQVKLLSDVQPKRNVPAQKKIEPIIIGGSLASGTGLLPFALKIRL